MSEETILLYLICHLFFRPGVVLERVLPVLADSAAPKQRKFLQNSFQPWSGQCWVWRQPSTLTIIIGSSVLGWVGEDIIDQLAEFGSSQMAELTFPNLKDQRI